MAVLRKLSNHALTIPLTELLEKYELFLMPGEELDEIEVDTDPETGQDVIHFFFDQVDEKEVV